MAGSTPTITTTPSTSVRTETYCEPGASLAGHCGWGFGPAHEQVASSTRAASILSRLMANLHMGHPEGNLHALFEAEGGQEPEGGHQVSQHSAPRPQARARRRASRVACSMRWRTPRRPEGDPANGRKSVLPVAARCRRS